MWGRNGSWGRGDKRNELPNFVTSHVRGQRRSPQLEDWRYGNVLPDTNYLTPEGCRDSWIWSSGEENMLPEEM